MVVIVSPFRSRHPLFTEVRLHLQIGNTFSSGEIVGDAMSFEIASPPGSPWRANSDKRRFVYFAWLHPDGRIVRRTKLFQEDLPPDAERIEIMGLAADGSPASSRARLRV